MANEEFIIIPYSILNTCLSCKKEKYSKIEAYIYLVKEARWQQRNTKVKGISCGKNQLVRTLSELMSQWNMNNKNEVKRYLDFLEKGGWIKTEKHPYATLITVNLERSCNGNVTSNVTANVTLNATPNTHDDQDVTNGFVTGNVTANVTANVTDMLPKRNSSRAQVVFESFDNKQDNNNEKNKHVEVDTPLNPPAGEKPKGYENFDFSFVEDGFYDVLVKWLDYKRDVCKKKFIYASQSSLESCYKTLVKTSRGIPEAAMEIVQFSITCGYQGIFPPNGFWQEWERKNKSSQQPARVTNDRGEVMIIHPDWKYVGEDGRHYETMRDAATMKNSYEEYFQQYGNYVDPR